MSKPKATIVVVPRERFSFTRESLESILAETREPYELVYVDGGSPRACHQYLVEQSQQHAFRLVRREKYLFPNQARNIGWREVQTKYTVFIDNDVVVTPGWLQKLVQCAEETGAGVVGPLTCQKQPLHSEIHCAGGESGIRIEEKDGVQQRHFVERIYDQGRKVADKLPGYQRTETGLAEFHCVLAETDMLETMGGLDEGLKSSKEHVDFSMAASSLGRAIYFEPESLVTYVGGNLTWTDMPFYMLRWSDAWERQSLHHLRDKYDLPADGWVAKRLKHVGWRRRRFVLRPLCRWMTLGVKVSPVEKLCSMVERPLNRMLTNRHEKKAA